MKKLTTEEFIEKAKLSHGDRYDYSLVDYKNSRTKIKIICKDHGEFEQNPHSHSSGIGCLKCGILKCASLRKYTKEEFIKASTKIHGNKYNYSLLEYNGSHEKIKIICKHHGVFEQMAYSHLDGKGCIMCYGSKKKMNEEFIQKARLVHNDKYDYSLVEYKNNSCRIKIICKIHGEFTQEANSHISGSNCPKCVNRHTMSTEEFIEKAKSIHGDLFDYSNTIYVNSTTKVKFNCKINGELYQLPDHHLSGFLPKNKRNKYKEDFIKRAKLKFGNKFDYSLVEFKTTKINVKIICPIHGIFEQRPSNHLNSGFGCAECGIKESIGEKSIIDYLEKNNIKFNRQKKFKNCKYKNQLPFDFYLIDYNICIEYNGEQHYKPIEYFGGIDNFNIQILRDKIKKEYCYNNNIPLIIIKYDQNVEEILNENLLTPTNSLR